MKYLVKNLSLSNILKQPLSFLRVRIIVLFLAIFSCLLTQFIVGAPIQVEIDSPSAILINAESGAVLFEKNAHSRRFPASITKVATALFALEKKLDQLDTVIKADAESLAIAPAHQKISNAPNCPPYRLEWDGTHMGLKVGEELTLKVLLYGLMLSSGNDASNVIARFVSGSIPQFMQEMDAYFKANGIFNTSFNNPHGLHHPDHFTTAYDMAMISRLAIRHQVFREVVGTIRYPRPQTNKQPANHLVQHNHLIREGKFHYPHAFGIKTGYHSISGSTIVAAAEKDGRCLIAVILGAQDRSQRYREVIKLFEAGFAEKKSRRTLFAKEQDRYNFISQQLKKAIPVALKEDIYIDYYPSEEPKLNASIRWKENNGKILLGDILGDLEVKAADGRVVAKGNLFALENGDLRLKAQLGYQMQSIKKSILSHGGVFVIVLLIFPLVLLLWKILKKSNKVIKR